VPIDLPYSGELEIECTVIKGKHINSYLINDAEYTNYGKVYKSFFGGRFTHFSNFAAKEAKSIKRQGRLADGRYWIVVENPTWGLLVESSFDVKVRATLRP
jgi:hypothetical protein